MYMNLVYKQMQMILIYIMYKKSKVLLQTNVNDCISCTDKYKIYEYIKMNKCKWIYYYTSNGNEFITCNQI